MKCNFTIEEINELRYVLSDAVKDMSFEEARSYSMESITKTLNELESIKSRVKAA